MNKLVLITLSILLFQSPIYAQKWKDLENNFKNIPNNVRPYPLWFWNDSEVKHEELLQQVRDFKQAGYGGFGILPFGKNFRPEYLSAEYFKAYQKCIEEAKKLGMKLWIYDEYGFPSGTIGDINGDGIGRFKLKYPDLTNKRLDKTEYIPIPNSIFKVKLSDEKLMAVVAFDTINYNRIDLINYINNESLTWEVPKGAWKIMVFNCVNAGNSIIDYLDPNAVDRFIEMTHDKYYSRFSKYFGDVIEGTFFDEPTMYYAEGRTWTPEFNNKFKQFYGFSPALYYPALWYNIGEETVEARNYLFGFRSQLFSEGYIKRVNDWSKKYGILATGHLDNEEILNCVGTSGDFMKSFKYLTVPGIDKIGGDRPAERFYKLISSAAYNWDHSLIMSETYGAMGNISWNHIFSIAMDQYVKGINMLIPHAVWYAPEKITFLPELSLRNPLYADSLNVYNDYLSRLNILLKNNGRWKGDIAILYPIHTMQSEHYLDGSLGFYKGGVDIPYLDYITVSTNLFDSLGYDHIFLHPEVLDEKCSIKKGKLKLNNKLQYNSFSMLLVPSSKIISLENLKKIKKLADSGGTVIFTTFLPNSSTILKEDEQVKLIMKELIKTKNVHFIKDPTVENLKNLMDKYSDKHSIRFLNDPVKSINKMVENKNIWFFSNPDNIKKYTKIQLDGSYELEVWDPHTGLIAENSIIQSKDKRKTFVEMELEAFHSIFLIEK